MFEPYLKRWNLTPDGKATYTHSSDLLPVLFGGKPAMLKVARSEEEITGNNLMVWLAGRGAARVYAHESQAIVLERLNVEPSLADMALNGQDDQATRILCRAAAELHAISRAETNLPDLPTLNLPTLRHWFRSLEKTAAQGGLYAITWDIAQELLNTPQDEAVLHGDIHHENVLHSTELHSAELHGAERDWLLIDPKGIVGERGFDYANIFYNPTTTYAATPGRLARQLEIVRDESGLERQRLLSWIAAYGGLSAAWWLEDNDQTEAQQDLDIVEMALAELSVSG